MDEKDTVEATETDPVQPLGTAVDEPTTDSEPAGEEQIDKAAYEAALEKAAKAEQLEKELRKREQELNLRRNNEKKAELERLAAEGKDKERADALQAELDELREKQEAEARLKEVEDFREGILGQYPPEVQKAAKSLNLYWDESQDFEGAEASLKAKLGILSETLGSKPVAQVEEAAPEISANNPNLAPEDESEIAKLRKLSADELKKILPVSDLR